MKIVIALAAVAAAMPALAQPPAPPAPGAPYANPPGMRHHRPAGPMTRADVQARVQRMFARLDTNRDGFLTRDEIEAARTAHGGSRAAGPDAAPGARGGARFGRAGMGGFGGRAFERMDLDHDGRVSLQEATAFGLQAFDRADANHDGIVTPEERQAARAAMRGRRL